MANHRHGDYMNIPEDTLGVDVHSRGVRRSGFCQVGTDKISEHLQVFLRDAGVSCQKATPLGLGATAGSSGLDEDVFRFLKPIGLTIHVVKFLLSWHRRVTARKRRRLLPTVVVTLLAEHIPPRRIGPDEWDDTARLLALLLPEMQQSLETEFPTYNFRYEFHTQSHRIPYVLIRAGDGLDVSDQHVLQMLEHLERDTASMTLFHREGWFTLPKVVAVNLRVQPLRLPVTIPN